MAFFGFQEAHLARENSFFNGQMGKLRIKSAGVYAMCRVDRFYAAARKNIFSRKKSVKKNINYFSMAKGASSYFY